MNKREKVLIYIFLGLLFVTFILFLSIKYKQKILNFNRVLVYFLKYDEGEQRSYLTSVMREVSPVANSEERVSRALRELLNGPTEAEKDKGLITSMPEGASLLNVTILDGTAYLDFSKNIEEGGGISLMIERLAQIVYTATQFSSIENIRLTIDGKEIEYFSSEGIMEVASLMDRDNFKEFFNRNTPH